MLRFELDPRDGVALGRLLLPLLRERTLEELLPEGLAVDRLAELLDLGLE